ncbi:hypothetical protein [Roseicella aquatilis]|uniref:Uncharacterized protein n=1 Tax=Roseicella aquatilis TaxID=2527868 RepID=A0A4R4DCQ5_9PROT|nr:hypothetical protein [Roseicella aquatilis]TCZ57933.1 hypothetical protein EXY23_17250 [Roseicella aquatilis]
MTRWIAGWLLEATDRDRLLALVPPRYPHVVAHHVTLQAGVPASAAPPGPRQGSVVGIADDGAGVQALVVEVDGSTRRPDGSTWHVTWSLGKGRRAVESNDVIRTLGWTPTARHPLGLRPATFRS